MSGRPDRVTRSGEVYYQGRRIGYVGRSRSWAWWAIPARAPSERNRTFHPRQCDAVMFLHRWARGETDLPYQPEPSVR